MTERTVVITGAAGGIGGALCERFFSEGWYVIASDQARSCTAPSHHYIPLDLARICVDEEYAQDRLSVLRQAIPHSTLNALINNAAVQVVASFEDLSIATWETVMRVNLLAPVVLSKECLPDLRAAQGAILNIGSIHSQLTKPRFTAYATSKAGLMGLTRALAVELGGSVRVNAINLAATSTPMLAAGFKDNAVGLEALHHHHPSGCIGTAGDVAEAASYLVGDRSMFVTGTILDLSGAIVSRLHDPE